MWSVAVREEPWGGHQDAVVVEVSGHGYYTGEATYWVEEDDPRGHGFLVK